MEGAVTAGPMGLAQSQCPFGLVHLFRWTQDPRGQKKKRFSDPRGCSDSRIMPELTYFRFPQPCLGWPTLYNPGLWQVTSCQTEDHRSPATSSLALLLPWTSLGNTIAWSALRVPGDLSSCNVHLLGRLALPGLWLPVLSQVLAWGRHAAWPVTESPSRTVCEPSGSPPRPRPPLPALPGVSADPTGSLLLSSSRG